MFLQVQNLLLLAASLATSVFAYPNPGVVTGNTSVHDPSLCKDGSGTYFLFSTAPGIAIRTSKDRTAFSYKGEMFPGGSATWTDQYTLEKNGNLWAPECYWDGSQFWVYYSASSFGSQNSAIFLATSRTGNPGDWQNRGLVHSTKTGDAYNSIDPNLYIESGKWYLTLGSFWGGIQLTTLNPSTGLASGGVSAIATRSVNDRAVEASTIYKHGNFYYLFTSWDKCCSGTSSTYNIRVGRSSSVTGSYVDANGVPLLQGGGTLVLQSHDAIVGPGGQDILVDGDGTLLVYHYYTAAGSFLGINLLDFSSGWPVAY